jgi:hypothetical protein
MSPVSNSHLFYLQSAKKTDAATPDDKKTEAVAVAPAGEDKKDESSVKKRK